MMTVKRKPAPKAPRKNEAQWKIVGTPEFEKLMSRLENGMSLRDACSLKDMPHNSDVIRQAMNDMEFHQHYARERMIGYPQMADDLITTAKKGKTMTQIASARLEVETKK